MTLEDLNQHLDLVQKLQKAQEIYASMQAQTIGCQNYDGMPHGTGISDKTGMLAIELADLASRIAFMKTEVEASARKVQVYARTIEDDRIRTIIRLRFLYGRQWCEVAGQLGDGSTEEAVKMACYRFVG